MSEILYMTNSHFQNHLTQQWLDGKVAAIDEVILFFRKKALQAFADGDDAAAKRFRDELPKLLKELGNQMHLCSQEHEKAYCGPETEPKTTDTLVGDILVAAADEVMKTDSWPRGKANESDMQVIADNIMALDIDIDELMERKEESET